MSNPKVIIVNRPDNSMNNADAENVNTCNMVQAEIILTRLRNARELETGSQLIIVDLRETRLYQSGHIFTARSANCYTKTMAKRAIQSWDVWYSETHGCPAPHNDSPVSFISQISLVKPAIVVYNQRGNFSSNSSTRDKKLRAEMHFICALITRGNRVYMIDGGFEAFRNLRGSSDFIDRQSPLLINCFHTDDSSCSEAASPASLSDNSDHSSCVSRVFNNKLVITLNDSRHDISKCHHNKENPTHDHFIPGEISCHNLNGFDCSETEKIISCLKDSTGDETLVVRIKQAPLRASIPQNNDDVLGASISQILPYLYLGNARDSQDVDLLRQLNVTHIINVTDTLPMPFKRLNRIQYLHIPASDTTDQNLRPAFDRAVQFIEKARKQNGIVLVHCLAGVSRSVAVVIAYLLYSNRMLNVYKALEYVQARRSVAGPNLHFMGQLQAYYEDLHSHKSSIFCHRSNSKSKDKLSTRNSAENLTCKLRKNKLLRSVSLSSNWKSSKPCTPSAFHRISTSSKTSTPPFIPSPMSLHEFNKNSNKSLNSTWSVSTTTRTNRRHPLSRHDSHESKSGSTRLIKTHD
ncbi:unnamed protein product [Trichobilharzia szidati]|nr:unnamed protein product [Trichobilharzia szidati]